MPNWGRTTVGTNTADTSGLNQRIGEIGSLFPEDGTITSITAWVGSINSTTQRVKYAIYDAANNLLAETNVYAGSAVGTTVEAVTLDMTTPFTATGGSDYRLAILFESSSSRYNVSFTTKNAANSFSAWPNFTDPNTQAFDVGHDLSIYATYSTTPAASITDIDGDNDVQAGQSNVDIIMTATTGVTVSTLGGEALTINGVT